MWTRRKLIETLAVGAGGVALASNRAAAQGAAAGDDHKHNEAMWKACCDTCSDCAKACNKAFHHCLTQVAGGKAQHLRMAQIAADCAAFCTLSAEMLGRNSSLAMLSCHACAEACNRCAQECDSYETDLDMKVCAQDCRRCEESCRKMVQGGEGAGNRVSKPAATARPGSRSAN